MSSPSTPSKRGAETSEGDLATNKRDKRGEESEDDAMEVDTHQEVAAAEEEDEEEEAEVNQDADALDFPRKRIREIMAGKGIIAFVGSIKVIIIDVQVGPLTSPHPRKNGELATTACHNSFARVEQAGPPNMLSSAVLTSVMHEYKRALAGRRDQ